MVVTPVEMKGIKTTQCISCIRPNGGNFRVRLVLEKNKNKAWINYQVKRGRTEIPLGSRVSEDFLIRSEKEVILLQLLTATSCKGKLTLHRIKV